MKTRSAIFCLGMVAILGMFAVANPAHAQDKLIKIGGLFPMSGPGAYFGAQDKQGIELAIEQFNKAGVNGYKLEVKFEDFGMQPAAGDAGRQAPARTVQAACGCRRGVL